MPADYTIKVEKHNYGEPGDNNIDLLKTPEKSKINKNKQSYSPIMSQSTNKSVSREQVLTT